VDGLTIADDWVFNPLETDGGLTQVLTRYVKQQVGDGMEFSNEIARVVVSSNGCYYEFLELPEEFSGALGEFTHHFVGVKDTLYLLERLFQLPHSEFMHRVRELSLFVVYERFDWISHQNIYAYHFQRSTLCEYRMEDVRGVFRHGQLPRFFKLRLIAERAPEGLSFACGIAFFIANPGERHLLVQVPYTHTSVSDLIARPLSVQLH
jgi:hypothetical protein